MINDSSETRGAGEPGDDPLGLDAVDQQIRIHELRTQVEALGMSDGEAHPDTPPEIEEAFLKNVIAYETADETTHFAMLEPAGVVLPPPEELDDAALTAKLWEVIHALARLNTFLLSTNHLSDRELYSYLWHDALREFTPDLPPDSGWNCHLDLVSSGSDEATDAYLRYYADEETRERWRHEFPDTKLPPHEDAPYDRDRRLPRSAEPV